MMDDEEKSPSDEASVDGEVSPVDGEVSPVDAEEAALNAKPDVEEGGDVDSDDLGEIASAPTGVEVIDESIQYEYGTPTVATFKDHFTLPLPSSTVRYRHSNGAARVVEGTDTQFVLEESYDQDTHTREISIRQIHNTSEGVRVLRAMYAIVTAFWTGFLFVFCLQVLLFLFLDLAIQLGITTRDGSKNIGAAIGSIFSIIPFVYGLASSLVIAGAFIVDTFRGHALVRNFTFRSMKVVTFEWLFFAFFLGIPLCVLCITLLAGNDDWWTITGLCWFCCVMVFFLIFTVNVVFYEMRACWEVTRNRYPDDDDSVWGILQRSILLRQTSTYAGRKTITYLSMGTFENAEATDKTTGSERNMVGGTRQERVSLRAKWTLWGPFQRWGLFRELETPERIYTVEDARDVRPYITSYSWNLEKIFCRPRNSRYIAIVKGPGAITKSQMKSSFACSVIGSFLVFFIILSVLVYLEPGAVAIGFLLAVSALIAWPNFVSTYRLFSTAKDLMYEAAEGDPKIEDVNSDNQEESEGVYLVQERYRVSTPTPRCAWTFFGLEVGLMFVWPLVSLFSIGNYTLALLYLVVAGVSGLRYYVNAAVVLEETGHMDLVGGTTENQKWRNQSRLNEIVGNITRGRSQKAWTGILGVLALVFLALFAGAVGTEQATQTTWDTPYTYLNDWEYPQEKTDMQQGTARYPSCTLSNDLGGSPLTTMADYTYLAGLAYRGIDVTQGELDGWFGVGNATDLVDEVKEYRETHDVDSQVSFKLITYPKTEGEKTGEGDFAYVLIRGTTNMWDMMTDAQLWSAAALMQVLREILPFGQIWTPIMPLLINAITTVESESIEAVSFYKDTVEFTNWVKDRVDEEVYAGLGITGHSLGGGLSIITGAQTKVPAVALSGPNTMLTRKSLDPQISSGDLDRYTFNIIPERDVVPMIDDPAQSWQHIRCLAGYTDVVGCHDSTRSLCEIIYTCGTGGRPALCECVTLFGYPEPTPKNPNQALTFAQACNLTVSSE